MHRARFAGQVREDRLDHDRGFDARAMMRIAPPLSVQVLTSMPNTRLRRCGHVGAKGKA
jgi:hypothetical protein